MKLAAYHLCEPKLAAAQAVRFLAMPRSLLARVQQACCMCSKMFPTYMQLHRNDNNAPAHYACPAPVNEGHGPFPGSKQCARLELGVHMWSGCFAACFTASFFLFLQMFEVGCNHVGRQGSHVGKGLWSYLGGAVYFSHLCYTN
jgi:hypothetical protein